MSLELAIVTYHGDSAAESAFGTLRERAPGAPWTHEAALVQHHHNDRIALHGTVAGRYVSVDEEDHLSQPGAARGAIAGGAIGLLLLGGPAGLAPGLVIGGIVGAEAAHPDEVEAEPGPLVDDLRAAVPKGCSAIVLLAAPDHVDEMLALLAERSGDVVRRPLGDREMARFEAALAETPAASTGPRDEGEAPPSLGDPTAT